MRHFPIFLDLAEARVVLAGGGETALAKLRLLLRTPARIEVWAEEPHPEITALAEAGRISLHHAPGASAPLAGARLVYAAQDDTASDRALAARAVSLGILANVVDDPAHSAFLTPAIVDRDPVVVAIGTEGTAPVLARRIKESLEAGLSAGLGAMARAAGAFRGQADELPRGAPRRAFWQEYFDRTGPETLAAGGAGALPHALTLLRDRHAALAPAPGRVAFVGAGPGNPELLTLRARRLLDAADVVIHDRLVPQAILDLARREATMIAAGKEGFGPSVPQAQINALLVQHAANGALVVRLKSGDPGVFGRLDEELDALAEAGIAHEIVPGITAAAAAAARIGQSLTRRGRNSDLRLLTGHDAAGFADQDWRALARPGAVAAIYMGKRAARFLQGRLMMHGADPATPVTLVENAARPEERVIATHLAALPDAAAALAGPAVILLGLAPRDAEAPALPRLEEALP